MWISMNYGGQISMVIWYKWQIIQYSPISPWHFQFNLEQSSVLLRHWGHASPSVDMTIVDVENTKMSKWIDIQNWQLMAKGDLLAVFHFHQIKLFTLLDYPYFKVVRNFIPKCHTTKGSNLKIFNQAMKYNKEFHLSNSNN